MCYIIYTYTDDTPPLVCCVLLLSYEHVFYCVIISWFYRLK